MEADARNLISTPFYSSSYMIDFLLNDCSYMIERWLADSLATRLGNAAGVSTFEECETGTFLFPLLIQHVVTPTQRPPPPLHSLAPFLKPGKVVSHAHCHLAFDNWFIFFLLCLSLCLLPFFLSCLLQVPQLSALVLTPADTDPPTTDSIPF